MQECEVFRLELAQMDLWPNQIIADTIRCTWEETSKDYPNSLAQSGTQSLALRKKRSSRVD